MKQHKQYQRHGLKLLSGIVIAIAILAVFSLLYGLYLSFSRPTASDKPFVMVITGSLLSVQDPAMRGLSYEVEPINLPSGVSKRYLIRDNNESYFNRCEYPVAIWPVDKAIAEAVMSGSDAALKEQHKQIQDQWYRVWLGTYWQNECAGATDEDDKYIEDLQKYVLENMGGSSADQ